MLLLRATPLLTCQATPLLCGAVYVVAWCEHTQEDTDALLLEVQFLRELNHDSVLKLYDFYDRTNSFYLVVELISGGELFDRITEKTVYNEKEARDLVKILLDVLLHLAEHNIVHRDLKPENLLLKRKEHDHEVVLIDFGFAERCNGRNLTQQCGTPK